MTLFIVTWSSPTEPELVEQGAIVTNAENSYTMASSLFFEAIDKRINPVEVINSTDQCFEKWLRLNTYFSSFALVRMNSAKS